MNFYKAKAFFTKGPERSLKAKKSIIASFIVRGGSIITSLLIIPLTLDYVNATQYGIWLTISSLVMWLSYFDVGFTNGFKNRFAEAIANDDVKLARALVSTTYASLLIIFSIIGLGLIVGNQFFDWSHFLKVSHTMNPELKDVFLLLIVSFCFQMVLKVITALLTANQQPALASSIDVLSQVLVLAVIFIMTKTTVGTLFYLALIIAVVPVIVYIFTTLYFFCGKYENYKPSFKSIDFGLVKSIIGLGGKFFVIQLALVGIFGLVNIVLVRITGPDSVTIYNIGIRYFTVISLIMNIILSPFWSAYTDAYTKSDYFWMKSAYAQLNKSWIYLFVMSLVMLLCSPLVFDLWIGDRIQIPFFTSSLLVMCQIFMTRASLYMIPLNGIGKVQVQMYIYIVFAILMYPLLIWTCTNWGLNGVIFATSLPFILQTIINHVQLKKILNQSASGLWDK